MASKSKSTMKAGVHLLKTTVTHFKGKTSQGKIEFYWHIVASNGRIIARSSETYSRKRNAINSIRVASDIFQFDFEGLYYDHSCDEIARKSIVQYK